MRVTVGQTQLEMVKGDITQEVTDAVVNAANRQLAPGGGVAGAIHRAAGPGLWEECQQLGGIDTGEAVITSGHNFWARYVIHTVGPVYSGAPEDSRLLARSYRNSLRLAVDSGLSSIAFPSLSTGAFGYPHGEAAQVAMETVVEFLQENHRLHLVRFVLFDCTSWKAYVGALRDLV